MLPQRAVARARRPLAAIACALGLTVGLSGCATDPAFWNAVSAGLDYAAYSALLDQTSCRRHPRGCGYGHGRYDHRPPRDGRHTPGPRPRPGPPGPDE